MATATTATSGQTTTPEQNEVDFDTKIAKLLENYEGLRTKAYKDTEGIPTIGLGATHYPSGFRLSGKVKMGDSITKEEAYEIKKEHIKEHRQRLVNEITQEVYDKLPNNVKAALESKVFNYGKLGTPLKNLVTTAVGTGDYKPVSDYFRNTLSKHNNSVNSWRRNDEADIIDSGKGTRVPDLEFTATQAPAAPAQPAAAEQTNISLPTSLDSLRRSAQPEMSWEQEFASADLEEEEEKSPLRRLKMRRAKMV